MIKKILRFFFDSDYRFLFLAAKGRYKKMTDLVFLARMYKAKKGIILDLKNPSSFTEKLQWLKLFDRKPIYSSMVDKYEAKKYVSNVIGESYIVRNYGCWDRFEDIDFAKLPNQFVLKCTHDSGGIVICRDKNNFDIKKAKKRLKDSLKRNMFFYYREWPYKNVRPRIIAEEFLENANKEPLIDYKFYCFNGEPKFLYISKGLDDHSTASISFVNLNWTFSKYERSDFKPFETLPTKPTKFNEMIELSKELSKGIPFLRVDLYQINEKIYFSELTFSPCGGFMPFKNEHDDIEIGKMLNLPVDFMKKGEF